MSDQVDDTQRRVISLSDLPVLDGADVSPTELTRRDGTRRISNSEVQTFKRCRRKWWYTYFLRLQRRHESPVGPLATGTRVHEALRFHYATRVPGYVQSIDARDALEALIVHERTQLAEIVDITEDTARTFEAEADLQRIMIDGYLQWLEDTGEDANYEVIGAEVYREVNLPELPVKLIARLDARVRRLTNDTVIFMDHKTCATFDPLVRTLSTSEQMLWYILIEQLIADTGESTDEPVRGAVYNMLRKVKRTVRAKPPFYMRHSVYHNHIELRAFQMRVLGVVETILSAEARLTAGIDHRRVAYPTPTRDCAWDCTFNVICKFTDDGSYVEEMIERFFINGDPLNYYARGQGRLINTNDGDTR